MIQAFDDLRHSPQLKQVGCVIVAILTHGKCDSNGEVIFGVDGMMFFKFDVNLFRGEVVIVILMFLLIEVASDGNICIFLEQIYCINL